MKGGKSGTCPDMQYHLPQTHLIKSKSQLSHTEVDDLLLLISKTRRTPRIVGIWVEGDHEVVDKVILYENINFHKKEK